MEYFAIQDPRFNSFYFDLNIWFRAPKVIGTLEKRAPANYFKYINKIYRKIHVYHKKANMHQVGFLEASIEN